jgi:hypothetical protein
VYEVAPVEVPEPVMHEAQAKFVESQAYPVAQPSQVKASSTTEQELQLATFPV